MDKEKIAELQNKIVEGLKISAIKLFETKLKNNGTFAIYHEGKIKTLKASELPR